MPVASWGARPDAMRNVPLLGVLLDKSFDVTQQFARGADLVGPRIARRSRVDERRALCHEGVVRKPVDANREERRA